MASQVGISGDTVGGALQPPASDAACVSLCFWVCGLLPAWGRPPLERVRNTIQGLWEEGPPGSKNVGGRGLDSFFSSDNGEHECGFASETEPMYMYAPPDGMGDKFNKVQYVFNYRDQRHFYAAGSSVAVARCGSLQTLSLIHISEPTRPY